MAINKLVAGAKGDAGNSTGADIAATVNGLIDFDYTKIKERFLNALSSDVEFTYIVTGDSTRDSVSTPSIAYYEKQLPKVNFSVYNNSQSGQSAGDWKDNIGSATLQDAIDNTSGSGDTTILEMSLGINKQGSQTPQEVKDDIFNGITSYLAAKPDALIVFVSPVTTASNLLLEDLYKDLADEFNGSVFVSGLIPTVDVYGDVKYYSDATHPNSNGIKRVVNYIMSNILPINSAVKMTIENTNPANDPSNNLPSTVEQGLYSTTTGAEVSNAGWRRLSPISVEPNFTIRVDHGGERYNAIFMDINGDYITDTVTSEVAGESYRTVVVPPSAYEVRLIVSADGANYDLLNYNVSVKYEINQAEYMPQQIVNAGLSIGLPIVENLTIDSSGSNGSLGQVATSQGDGTWLWA